METAAKIHQQVEIDELVKQVEDLHSELIATRSVVFSLLRTATGKQSFIDRNGRLAITMPEAEKVIHTALTELRATVKELQHNAKLDRQVIERMNQKDLFRE